MDFENTKEHCPTQRRRKELLNPKAEQENRLAGSVWSNQPQDLGVMKTPQMSPQAHVPPPTLSLLGELLALTFQDTEHLALHEF